jgi:hypothetical protein
MAALLQPLRVRFTDPQDVELYGDRWWVYDERTFTRLPARTLMAYETEIGAPLADMMTGVRASSAWGDMTAVWVALKLALGDDAPAYAEFNPITMMIEWEPVPAEDLEPGKDETPAASLEPGGRATDAPSGPVQVLDAPLQPPTSPTDTVSLPIMPVSA